MCDFSSSVGDYTASSIPSTITIPAGMLERCFNVTIVDDVVRELDEGFQISARLQGSTTIAATVGVTILDDDGKMGFSQTCSHIHSVVHISLQKLV